jgi:diguanylate cyclase (GGDEF)-like protein
MGYPNTMRDIIEHEKQEAMKKKKKTLENITIIDHHTGLYNREYFHLRMDQEMFRSKLYGNNLSLILLTLCNASQDGTITGNTIYQETVNAVSEIISICLNNTVGLTFLYDKGKIAVILPELNKMEAMNIAKNIQKMIGKEKRADIHLFAGVAQYNGHEYMEELVKTADDALAENMKSAKGRQS